MHQEVHQFAGRVEHTEVLELLLAVSTRQLSGSLQLVHRQFLWCATVEARNAHVSERFPFRSLLRGVSAARSFSGHSLQIALQLSRHTWRESSL